MSNTNNNMIKGVSLLLLFFSSYISFAADAATTTTTLTASIYTLTTIIAQLLGITLMVYSLVKLKKSADNPNDPKNFPMAILTTIIVGASMFNYSGTASVSIGSFLGDDGGFCMLAMEEKLDGEVGRTNCWKSDSSELMTGITERIEKSNGAGSAAKFNEIFVDFMEFFQVVGFIYFLKNLWELHLLMQGTSQKKLGGVLIGILASSLAIDLPHTLEIVKTTVESIFSSY
nr:hypothetical protein [Moritella viscosa]SHO15501.1 Putative uncharacterized protein [Moritella viscosa]